MVPDPEVSHGRSRPGRRLAVVTGILSAVVVAAALVVGVRTLAAGPAQADGSGRAGVPVRVKGHPVGLAADDRTGTVYAAAGRDGLFMFSAAGCGSAAAAGCDARRVAAGGQFAAAVAVDSPAATVYVANGPEQTVSVFGTDGCDAAAAHGCARPVAVIHLPGAPRALAVDPRAGTVYAAFVPAQGRRVPAAVPAGEVAVISARACNASGTRGCTSVLTAPLGRSGPAAVAVDQATGTVYVTQGSSLEIINGSACVTGNAPGCRKIVPVYGYLAAVTAGAPGRVYVTSPDTGTVTGISTSTSACAAAAASHCGSAVLIRAGAGPAATAIGGSSGRTLYVADFTADTVSMVNLDRCAGAGTGGCSSPDPVFPVGDEPAALAADPVTRTLYVANFGSGTVTVISTAGCDAVSQRGCPARPPAGTQPVRQPPAACSPQIAAYQSGLPAGPFLSSSVRVAGGRIGGQPWSLRALRGVAAPDGIEEGGLVIGGRWYALCSGPLDGGADAASIELIDTAGRGIVYGYIQHPVPVTPVLAGPGVPPHPTVIALPGTTFFIAALSRAACATPALTLHGRAPDWSGTARLTFGGCEPGLLVYIPAIEAVWGPGAGN